MNSQTRLLNLLNFQVHSNKKRRISTGTVTGNGGFRYCVLGYLEDSINLFGCLSLKNLLLLINYRFLKMFQILANFSVMSVKYLR